jgi:Winged helix DNA-binding domain
MTRSALVRARGDAAEVARATCGLQAQIQSAAELGIAIRGGGTVADARRAIWPERRLVRTWAMRGTLHLLATDDVALWLAALREAHPGWERIRGLDLDESRAVLRAVVGALEGRTLTRAELAERASRRLGGRFRDELLSPWGDFLGVAATAGKLCFAEPRGSAVTFARLDQWAQIGRAPDGPSALREAVRRYLRAYAPAKHADFAQWFGMAVPAAKRLFGSMTDEFAEVVLGSYRGWMLADDPVRASHAAAPSVRFLPQYDAYVVGFRPRDELVDRTHRARIAARPKGRLEGIVALCPVILDGRVVGLWSRGAASDRLSVELFARGDRTVDAAIEAERRRITRAAS